MSDVDPNEWTCPLNRHCCEGCLNEAAIWERFRDASQIGRCSYCQRSGARIALDDVVGAVSEAVYDSYCDPADTLPYEGGYIGQTFDTAEILERLGFEPADDLLHDITVGSPISDWAEVDWAILSEAEKLRFGWAKFKDVVKHRRRFTFWSEDDGEADPSHPDYLPVGRVLNRIAADLRTLGLLRVLAPRTSFWRVRIHATDAPAMGEADLAAPPTEKARQSNRMSPAGVPMFYGADDLETAKLETVDPTNCADKLVTGATFELTAEIVALDLTRLPPVPSAFSGLDRSTVDTIGFLHHFVRDLTLPIQRDGSEHVDYVPTQALTEFVRFHVTDHSGRPVEGILYPSSKTGRMAAVLFFDHECCLSGKRQRLAFQPASRRTESPI